MIEDNAENANNTLAELPHSKDRISSGVLILPETSGPILKAKASVISVWMRTITGFVILRII